MGAYIIIVSNIKKGHIGKKIDFFIAAKNLKSPCFFAIFLNKETSFFSLSFIFSVVFFIKVLDDGKRGQQYFFLRCSLLLRSQRITIFV